MKPQLPNSLNSLEDLKEVINDIRSYSQWFSQYLRKQQVTGQAQGEPPTILPEAVELINGLGSAEQLNQPALDGLIGQLTTFAEQAPKMTITLAAPIPGELKKALINWCRQNISPDILAEFKFNSTLMGGMVVQYGSHIYDWSFRRQILANRDKFPEVLRNV